VTTPATENLLVVDDWESRCSACGGGATTSETAHVTQLPGYSDARVGRGCGRVFTGVALAEDARADGRVHASEIAARHGIPFVGVRPLPRQPVGGAR